MAQEMTANRPNAMYERRPIPIDNPADFGAVKSAVENAFSSGRIEEFLRSLDKDRLRIREWNEMLAAGKMGAKVAEQYHQLSPGDQGQIRELYLANLEQVQPALRDKYFKLYAYY